MKRHIKNYFEAKKNKNCNIAVKENQKQFTDMNNQ